jgi:SAM-dependent methyltransferase
MGDLGRFSGAFPGHQTALDIFRGDWTTTMPEGSGLTAGERDHSMDRRVTWGAAALGGLAGKTILELGPFEAYQTRLFENMGAAAVISIENNRDNFLKCLIVKNIVGLRAVFLHGDMLRYLHETDTRYDVCWASGVLYHMTDPLGLLRGMSRVSNTLLIWTHYIHPERMDDPEVTRFLEPEKDVTVEFGGREIQLHHRNYNQPVGRQFSGGQEAHSYWMKLEDIRHVLAVLGFSQIDMGFHNLTHPSGAACCFLARRPTMETG